MQTIVEENKINGINYLEKFGIKISNQPMKVNSRILDPPIITYKNNQIEVKIEKK